MRKTSILNLLFTTLIILLLTSCTEEDNLPNPDFVANQYSSTNKEISIAFTDLSTNDAEEWIWAFEGGTPSVSYERDPIVTYDEAGTFNVTLTVRNGHGTREITKFDYVNVGDFYNPTWADIYVTYKSETKVVPIDDYVLLAEIGSPAIEYYGETSGRTSDGLQVGLLLYWNESVVLNDNALFWDFIIDEYFVFINIQNYGPDNFYPFTVNWGDPEYEITDNITIPNDGVWRATGYYDAWSDMVIVAYFESLLGDVTWTEGVHFDLLWVVNQGLDIWYDGSKSNLKSKTKSKELRGSAKPIIQSGTKRKK